MTSPSESRAAPTGDVARRTYGFSEQRRGTRNLGSSRRPREILIASFVVLSTAILAPSLAFAQAQNAAPQSPEDEPPTRRLTLHPAAEPRPALEYQLLPSLLDRRPGNAAVLYNKIGLTFRGGPEFKEEWIDNDLPLDKFPREEARKVVEHWRQVLDDLELASRREECNWELPIHEREFISLMLPEIEESRAYARLLSLKARLQVAEGDFDSAVRTLRTGYAMGRHVAKSPTLVSALVGVVICSLMDARVEELAAQPGAPSLYWALTALPRPLIDFRLAADSEKSMLFLTYPELRDLHARRHSPEDWLDLLDKLSDELARVGEIEKQPLGRLTLTGLAMKGYPAAKRRLIELGRSPEQVEAMPVAEVVLLYSLEAYEEAHDATLKWVSLPYWEAAPRLAAIEQEIAEKYRAKEILPFNIFLTPTAFIGANARSERNVAILRVIEAIRLYASSHDGRLPKNLNEIVDVPVPLDAFTGGPFLYRLDGDVATLEAPLPPNLRQQAFGARYVLTFAR